jgi:transposase-like protein
VRVIVFVIDDLFQVKLGIVQLTLKPGACVAKGARAHG